MKQFLTIIVSFFICFSAISQRKTRGDRFFENGDFYNAITNYQRELDRGNHSKNTIQNLAISYYNTFQFRKAYRYLNYVIGGKFIEKDKSFDNAYYFKMYHVLSALGEYDKAIPYLEKYQQSKNIALKKREDLINTIEEFKLKDDDFTVSASTLNTERAEFGAIKKDSFIYFTSDRSPNSILKKNYKWTHRPFLDIYKVKVDSSNTAVEDVYPFSPKVNSNLHEGNFCFTKDGKTLYLSKSNSDRGKRKFDSIRNNAIHLYRSVKNDSLHTWSKPEKLSFNDYTFTTEHPCLNVDETKLYFSSNRPGGYGEFDLYYVTINEDGSFGTPTNLGETINTPNREQFPFINEENDLYFASNGHLGLGMLDLFASKHNQETYEKPVNLGSPINSSFDDFAVTFYQKNKGFFASNRVKTDDNIYTFNQIGSVFPKPLDFKFEVRDIDTQKFIPDATVSLFNREQELIIEKTLDSISTFEAKITPGKYELKATANLYEAGSKTFFIRERTQKTYILYLKQKEVIEVVKAPVVLTVKEQLLQDKVGPPIKERNGKMYFELPPIYFDFDKWNIREDSKKVLDQLALKLEKYPSIILKINAHTDSRGTASYNQLLSERRAESTRNYLALVGYVNARRLTYKGFGESQLLIECKAQICSEEDHQINRRSEFEITSF